MFTREQIILRRECEVTQIPSGIRSVLPEGITVKIMQSLGGSYTVVTEYGHMYRVDSKDAELLGLAPQPQPPEPKTEKQEFSEQLVWEQLKTIYDPEIPVNVVDLGLIYSCAISPVEQEQYKIEVRMSMTAPGCGMGNVLKADVENKLARLPNVKEVRVDVVFDPPWHPGRMSETAKLQLGLDLDYSPAESALPIFPDRK